MARFSMLMPRGWVIAAWLVPIVLAIALTALLADPAYLQNDAAQYIAGARNLVSGNGFATDLIYYDSHYLSGEFPASQTVFPPGYSILIAGLSLAGLDTSFAAIAVNLISLCLIPALLYLWLRLSGVAVVVSTTAALMHLGLQAFWFNALQGQSEASYTLFTLMCLYAICRAGAPDGERGQTLLIAGLAAAAAMATRYQGIFLVASLALVFGVRWTVRRDRGSARALLLTVGPPALVAALLFWRNLVISGDLAGGPISTANNVAGPGDVIAVLVWELSRLFGFSRAGFTGAHLAETGLLVLLVVLLIAILAMLIRAWRGEGFHKLPIATGSAALSANCAVAYVGVSFACLVLLTFVKSTAYMQDRFLLTLAPVVLYLLSLLFSALVRAKNRNGLRTAVIVLGLAVYSAGQFNSWDFYLHDTAEQKERYEKIEAALAAPLAPAQSTSVALFLQAEIDSGRHLFSLESQRTGMILDRGVLGPAPAQFTDRQWGEERVGCLARQYGIRYVLHYPALFDPERGQFSTTSIIAGLHDGISPQWLTFKGKNRNLMLYEVEGEAPCDRDQQ